RICPGRHLADTSLSMTMASLLWAFDFEKPKNARGNMIKPNVTHENDIIRSVCCCVPALWALC
ncbi:hypothetical protein PAXINDRAFT_83135, partial [Paxillus involutus ATCC 200175]